MRWVNYINGNKDFLLKKIVRPFILSQFPKKYWKGRWFMNSIWLILIGIVAFIVAYITYGAWLAKKWGIDDEIKTPAHTLRDDIDYCPTKTPVLLGHHFASIAGAGPILGPIQAAVFGWVPVFLWVVLGSIFVGGVHDMGSLFASIRHEGKSIGEIIHVNIGKSGKQLFNIFAWLTLLLVVAAFTSICAETFTATPEAGTSSLLFIVLAILFGYFVYRRKLPLWIGTIVGVALLFFCVWLGYVYPLVFSADKNTNILIWDIILLVYITIASIVPVWILLQPRDYLNSYLLYGMLAGAVVGLFIMRPDLKLPAFTTFNTGGTNYLFPMLFVTVACGAISGFHSLVGSGTSSKQLNKESDTRRVGYGAMLIEGMLAVVALISVAYIATSSADVTAKTPTEIFATGSATFMNTFGLPVNVGKIFVSLAISAFALTSLDTATRIGRYVFQEFFTPETKDAKKSSILTNRYVSTIITVLCSAVLTFIGYRKVWPVFGSANQMLAALALMGIAAYLIKMGKKVLMIMLPMALMFAVTLTALVLFMINNVVLAKEPNYVLFAIALILFVLAIILLIQALKVFFGKKKDTSANINV